MKMEQGRRENWGTRIGVILAVTGSAVGLGNFLRFPGLAAQYEGGAFLIPYFLALLLLGLPIALAEWTMGRYGGARGFNSPPGIFRAVWKSPLAPYVGALSAVVPVLIYMYYIHLEGWCLGYAWMYATGQMAALPPGADLVGGVRDPFIGMGGNGELFSGGATTALWFIVVSFIVNFVLIYRGVNKGIEWFSKIAMPALALCAFILLLRVLTLGFDPAIGWTKVLDGLGFMWNPGTERSPLWEQLQKGQMWIDATGQVFFTLSVGFGLIVTYASYVKADDDIALSAVTSAAGNEFTEVVLAGMTIVPAAFIFIGAEALRQTGGGSLAMGFGALPGVFQHMPAGSAFGFLFFFLLFLAAITSSLSMLQPSIAMLEEGLGLGRKAAVAVLGFITATGAALIGYFSHNLTALGTVDFWIGSFALYALATILVVLFGWVMGIERGREEINRGAEIRIPGIAFFIIKYVAPVYLLTVFAVWSFQSLSAEDSPIHAIAQDRAVQITVAYLLLVIALFMLLAAQAVKRWRRDDLRQTEVTV